MQWSLQEDIVFRKRKALTGGPQWRRKKKGPHFPARQQGIKPQERNRQKTALPSSRCTTGLREPGQEGRQVPGQPAPADAPHLPSSLNHSPQHNLSSLGAAKSTCGLPEDAGVSRRSRNGDSSSQRPEARQVKWAERCSGKPEWLCHELARIERECLPILTKDSQPICFNYLGARILFPLPEDLHLADKGRAFTVAAGLCIGR